MNIVKADIDNFYNLLEDMTEDKITYYILKYPDDIYVEMAKELYNMKIKYPSLLVHPKEFINQSTLYSIRNNKILEDFRTYTDVFLYEGQFSYRNKIVFGLKEEDAFHFSFFTINVFEDIEIYFLDINDAKKYMEDLID